MKPQLPAGPLPALNEVRPEVAAFARLMEYKLRLNDYKGTWKDWDPVEALRLLREEADKVGGALSALGLANNGTPGYDVKTATQAVAWEAPDVANFAMMIVDTTGGLAALDPEIDLGLTDPIFTAFMLLNSAVHSGNAKPWVIQARNVLRWKTVDGIMPPEPEAEPADPARDTLQDIQDALLLVEIDLPLGVIGCWTTSQRQAVFDWASAAYLDASDNNVVVPAKPAVLDVKYEF